MKSNPQYPTPTNPATFTWLVLTLGMLLAPAVAFAANVSLTGNDAQSTVTSLNGAGKWSDGLAPHSGANYFTGGFFIRTPTDGGGVTYTFGGDSLTLGPVAAGNVRNIILKSGNNDTFIINNLTNAAGGVLENGGSGNVVATFTGNLYTIAGNSMVYADQGSLIIGYPLVGADGVILTNAGGNANGITYNNDNSAFKGKFYTSTANFGNGGGNTKIILNAANSAPGNPSTFTPDQILLAGGCTLQDNVGLLLNNANSGITLSGGATINAASTTVIGEPITDLTNGVHSVAVLTKAGVGMLVLSNANNNYSGGTTIAAGTLQVGIANALPVGNVTDNAVLDLNAINVTIGGLSGLGTVDTYAGGTPTLTVGSGGGSGTFTGVIQNTLGTLSLTKVGAGTQTLAGYTYGGMTLVAGGTLSLSSAGSLPITAGDMIVSNAAVLAVNASGGVPLPANNLVLGTNTTLNLTLNSTANGIIVAGGLIFQDNATNNFNYGTLTANPTSAAINVAGSISAPGSNIVININAVGMLPGTITLIKYTGTPLASIANFSLELTPGIFASLVNNTANDSIDLNITAVSKQVTWYGANGTAWDIGATANWYTNSPALPLTVYQQYTNGSIVAGDGVTFDDTLTNDFINPQPTNINVTGVFSPYPITFNSTLPYSLSGVGGLAGTASLVKSNTGSLTLLTSNSFTGGVSINGGSVVITNDSALGASGVGVALNGGTLGFAGDATSTRPITVTAASSIGVATNVTAQLNGNITSSAGLTKVDNGTLVLSGNDSINGRLSVNAGTVSVTGGTLAFTGNPSYVGYLNGSGALTLSGSSTLRSSGELRVGGSDTSGTGFSATGTVTVSSGNAYLSAVTLARGNNNLNSVSGTLMVSGGTLWDTNDFLAGYAGTGTGTLNISGTGTVNVGPAATKWFILGQYDTSGGNVTISGGNLNLMNNTAIKFSPGNGSTSGTNVFTLSGGTVTFYSDAGTTMGGNGDLNLAQSGSATANNTFNLDGGTLIVPQVGSASSAPRRIFNFNGGTLKATANNSTFMNLGTGNAIANVRNGGVIIDDGGFNIAIGQALVHSTVPGDNATDGGFTKNGSGTLTLSGANTYAGNTAVNAGTLLITTASSLQGGAMIGNNATLSITQIGSATNNIGNLTFNGVEANPGATLGLALGASNNSAVPFVNCGTLTLNGTNTISLAGAVNIGTIALIHYSTLAGSGNCTNLLLPQGAAGTITVDTVNQIVKVNITSTGPGLVWTGGINNLWDINTSTNWLLNSTITKYQQTIIPGDAVTFNDSGSGTVLVSNNVGPASMVISNNTTSYTFGGRSHVTGATGLLKLGAGLAIMNLTNNDYVGTTTISNGILRIVGNGASLSPSANLDLGPNGTLQMSNQLINATTTIGELTGSGVIDYNSGFNSVLRFGGSVGGMWNGTIQDHNGGGLSLTKTGSGTWVIGGTNHLDNTDFFNGVSQNQFNGGTTIITNGAYLSIPYTEFWIAQGAGSTSTVVVAGGTLAVSNDWLCVGRGDTTGNGTLIVNSGSVIKSGANHIVVGSGGASGSLIINGGQVLDNNELWLGENATANGNLYLNGGLLQVTGIRPNGTTPISYNAYFNGGTLRANTNNANFLQVISMVMSNGLVLDDNGYTLSIGGSGLQSGDAFNGGLVKMGTGMVYLDAANGYTGTTVVSNGTLAGVGTISGPVVVAPAGSIGAGDAGATISSPLYINNSLTLQGAAGFRVSNNGGFAQSDQIVGLTNINYGGTLVISNVTSDATALTNAVFQLFSLNPGATTSGNFTSIVGSPGTGLAYSFNPTNGVLSVVTAIASNPTNITFSVSGSTLSLSWPADHLGWILQVQTNNLSVGLNTNWVDIVGSESVTQTNISIITQTPSAFYRLRKP